MRDGSQLGDALKARLSDALRSGLSPRHQPDDIVAVPAIPRTMTGKKLELPVKRILTGTPVAAVVSPDALASPASIEPFAAYAAQYATSPERKAEHD